MTQVTGPDGADTHFRLLSWLESGEDRPKVSAEGL